MEAAVAVSQALIAETVKRTSVKVFKAIQNTTDSEHPQVHKVYKQVSYYVPCINVDLYSNIL